MKSRKKVYPVEALADLIANTRITMRKHLNADTMRHGCRTGSKRWKRVMFFWSNPFWKKSMSWWLKSIIEALKMRFRS